MTEEFDAPLARHTTLHVGGPARRLVTVTTTDDLVDAVRETDDADEPLLILGGGSNVVLPDEGFAGTVVKVATNGVTRESVDACGGALVRVAAGEVWDALVTQAVQEGWSGVEALSGIPGSVGATPVQNVGAYGQEVAQTIAQVRTWDRHAQAVRTFFAADCGFAYRHSLFKASDRYVVLDVLFQFVLGDYSTPIAYADLATQLDVGLGARVPLGAAREAVLAQRRRRGMVLDPHDHDTWSCGSFFTNPILSEAGFERLAARVRERLGGDAVPPRYPGESGQVKTSAAWLIERAGFARGFGLAREAGLSGRASLSTKHTLALTNRGAATAADILALARTVRDGVYAAFGVALVNEPILVGQPGL